MKKAHTKVNQDKKTNRETMIKKNHKILIIYYSIRGIHYLVLETRDVKKYC
jgi:hypothetical protein